MTQVVVVNVHHAGFDDVQYLGRGRKGRGSVLANPRRLGDSDGEGGAWERGDTVALFKRDLLAALDRSVPTALWWDGRRNRMRRLAEGERQAMRAEMNRLFQLLLSGQPVQLGCWCKDHRFALDDPRQPACHADVVRELLLTAFNARQRPAAVG